MTESQRLFPPTSLTLLHKIQRGQPKDRDVSLARFCSVYYPAVYGYARMRGLTIEDAKDRTQDFFVKVVRDELLHRYSPDHGTKLSSWLMVCFKNLIIKHRDHQVAQKRGGGREFVSFDTDFAEQSFQSVSAAHLPEESAIDLTLALSIWHTTKQRIMKRYAGTRDEALVTEIIGHVLLPHWPEPPSPSQTEIAAKHQRTTVQLKAFFNRTLKRHAREYFAEEAADSNAGIKPEEIEELWRALMRHASA